MREGDGNEETAARQKLRLRIRGYMEYREELLKVLVPMQEAVFDVDDDTEDIDEDSDPNFEMEM